MEPSKEAIAVRITRLNRQILGKVTSGSTKYNKKTIDREALFDALTALYDECNDDPIKKTDELVRVFVDKYRSTLADLRRTRVCYSDFEVLHTIGRGYFGEVHMVREKQTSDVYALKSVRKELARKRVSGAEDERDVLATTTSPWMPKLQYAFQGEYRRTAFQLHTDCTIAVEVSGRLQSDCAVGLQLACSHTDCIPIALRLHMDCMDNSNLYLVMELCSGGDLAGLLSRRNHPLSERDAAFYVCEVAHALKALHGMGYVHRDVKPHNILLDRCGHIKLGDFGSCTRLSEGGCQLPAGTPDYVAPELLAAAHCASTHAVCSQYCAGIVTHAISACDYWSLGVVAFELVTLRRPFSSTDEDSVAVILNNIQRYERDPDPQPPFEASPKGPSAAWRSLVSGLLRVTPTRRYNYLDTLQHAALAHIHVHAVRDQAPPWVPCVRGSEDASYLNVGTRASPPPSAAPFRTRPPFAGQLPFVGYSYVAPDENEDSSGGFNASHDCTAMDLATFKSAEKLAAMRSREITSLQNKLAAAEASVSAVADKTRREADAEAERLRARLQAEITALSLQNTRLERQIEVEKEERMALQRTNQELQSSITERSTAEARNAKVEAERAMAERDAVRADLTRLESRVEELQAELSRTLAAAEAQRAQHQHYKDSVAKERAIRRQTLSGGDEARETGVRLATAEANLARETRSREHMEKRLATLDHDYDTLQAQNKSLQAELDETRKQLAQAKEALTENNRTASTTSQQLTELQTQLAQERVKVSTLQAQVQELERSIEESVRRETALEEQCSRTEARLNERLHAAENRAASAMQDDARHREKVTSLEQLVRQLEREVSALEARSCPRCARAELDTSGEQPDTDRKRDAHSDTESVCDNTHAQLTVIKEQLERAERQLQARAEEIAALKQEARSANLARWRKEREYNELSVDVKATARELKRLEERLKTVTEARKTAEQKASALENEMATLKPQYEQANKEAERLKDQLTKLQKAHETAQAEVDRSRNDIRKLKSELQYSEKRRMHAEEQEELSARERSQLRDELQAARADNIHLVQNNKALQEACGLLEDQLTDLEKLADIHELKNKDLESEVVRMRSELEQCRSRLECVQRQANEYSSAASRAATQHEEAREQAQHANEQLKLLTEKLKEREQRVCELEAAVLELEGQTRAQSAAVEGAARRLRSLQEECAEATTRAAHHHRTAMQLDAALADAQEELAAAREAAEAATAWWRTRETKSEATIRQQAKLIDFLQAKVEEAGRKKCSLSNKLFGRSGRRNAASPPLRRVNRELRDEVERLKAKLAASNLSLELNSLPPTPRKEVRPRSITNGMNSIDNPDGQHAEDSLLIIWPDGARERMHAKCEDGVMTLKSGERELRAKLLEEDAKNLPQNESNRAFTIRLENCGRSSTAIVVCSNLSSRSSWVNKLRLSPPPASLTYSPAVLAHHDSMPHTALFVAPNAVAIGGKDGLHSLRGSVRLECENETGAIREVIAVRGGGGRALLLTDAALTHGGLLALGSTLRRAPSLHPVYTINHVRLPNDTPPHLLENVCDDGVESPCAAIACGRRVFVLRFDASASEIKISRSLTVDRPPFDLLLTPKSLFIAGEKPLKINLPSGSLESFASDELTVSAAARKHSPPRAILLVRRKPIEILLCYAECGVFVDENGRRTRTDDPRWSSAIHAWEFVFPFLYVIGEDKVTIIYINDESYRSPPCTCDTTSLASTGSDCCTPETYQLKLKEPALLGTAPNGIIVRTKEDDGYNVIAIEGMSAFRSIGASVESLETVSDSKGSSTDLAQSLTDLSPQDESHESVEVNTGFLADIRKRARQLREKNRQQQSSDDFIKDILTKEVSLKRSSGKKSPVPTSEFDSDSTESEENKEQAKGAADLCAEMFTRQVRFH